MARKKTELRFIPIDKHVAYLYIDDNASLSFEEHKEREREREKHFRVTRNDFVKFDSREKLFWKFESDPSGGKLKLKPLKHLI